MLMTLIDEQGAALMSRTPRLRNCADDSVGYLLLDYATLIGWRVRRL
jgi:hypothetical protein